jgi:hypothetical protein
MRLEPRVPDSDLVSVVGRWSERFLAVALTVMGTTAAAAQTGPFLFTVTTASASPSEQRWTVDAEAAYGKRAGEPFAFEGVGPRLAVRGGLGHGFTLLGQAGLRLDEAASARPSAAALLNVPTQQVELLKDLGPARGVGLAVGLGVRREWQGPTVLLGRVSFGRSSPRSSLFGNVRFERAMGPGRDALDLVTTAGWLRRFGFLHAGVEAIGEDLEGFWDPAEAEGGARLFAGPSLHFLRSGRPWSVSLCGGPIFYATRTGRSSGAARDLTGAGDRYAVRLSFGYSF